MAAADIDVSERDAFVAHAVNFDLDDNGYLKKAELEAAAKAWHADLATEEEAAEEPEAEEAAEEPEAEEAAEEDATEEAAEEDAPEESAEEHEAEEDAPEEAEEEEATEDESADKKCAICMTVNAADAAASNDCYYNFK